MGGYGREGAGSPQKGTKDLLEPLWGRTRLPGAGLGARLPLKEPVREGGCSPKMSPRRVGKGRRAASSRDGALGPAPAPPPRAHKGPPRPLPDPPRAVPTRPRGPWGGFGGRGRDWARAGARCGRRGSVPAGGRAGPAGSSLWAPGGGAVRGWRSGGGGCWKPGAGGCGGGRVRSAGPAPFGEPPPSGPPPPRPRPRLRPRPAPGARSKPSDMLPLRSGRGGAALGDAGEAPGLTRGSWNGRRGPAPGLRATAAAAPPPSPPSAPAAAAPLALQPAARLRAALPAGHSGPPRPGGPGAPALRSRGGRPRPSRPGARLAGPSVPPPPRGRLPRGQALTRRPGPRRAARREAGGRRLRPRK